MRSGINARVRHLAFVRPGQRSVVCARRLHRRTCREGVPLHERVMEAAPRRFRPIVRNAIFKSSYLLPFYFCPVSPSHHPDCHCRNRTVRNIAPLASILSPDIPSRKHRTPLCWPDRRLREYYTLQRPNLLNLSGWNNVRSIWLQWIRANEYPVFFLRIDPLYFITNRFFVSLDYS